MRVEIVVDLVCSWSYMGFTRLTRVAEGLRAEGKPVEVTVLPYQLAPDAPVEADGMPLLEVLEMLFGAQGVKDARRMAEMARGEGLTLDYDSALSANTFQAHRFIHLADVQGRGEQMAERLFRAHFTDGLNLGDLATLADLAAETGVTPPADPEEGAAETRALLAKVRSHGIRSVPLTMVKDGPTLPGFQSEAALHAALTASP
ncbi:DsbA family oxidoreductase [Actinocorallia sp. API 0066]|uniref:DsbA family oxidoreductase n=1 Tax=Actinocorallia sp. API 0066 TaxID=2896846 RepID=UPI001E2ED51B|nr:DsbA family oxidoreductase [Actinocorallia sp. API 0066]MCD0452407.1 DsbA family oxidoreductase [Actinocorallia sp. API 0066]